MGWRQRRAMWGVLALVSCVEPSPEAAQWSQFGTVDLDGDGVLSDVDCDDERPDVFPGAEEEVGDGIDQDCDGFELCHVDDDRDGFGGEAIVAVSGWDCDAPDGGTASRGTDCNDAEAWVNPAAEDHPADGVDQDCDGTELCFADRDLDGWGSTQTIASPDLACLGAGLSARVGDCDDADSARHPSRREACNGIDDDCDLVVDGPGSIDAVRLFQDKDRDGWGVRTDVLFDCPPRDGWARIAGDCNDLYSDAYPGRQELCDGVDNDCDLGIDEADEAVGVQSWFLDGDRDGKGDPDSELIACDPPNGLWVDNSDDCDDHDPIRNCSGGCAHGPGSSGWIALLLTGLLRRSPEGSVPERHGNRGTDDADR